MSKQEKDKSTEQTANPELENQETQTQEQEGQQAEQQEEVSELESLQLELGKEKDNFLRRSSTSCSVNSAFSSFSACNATFRWIISSSR